MVSAWPGRGLRLAPVAGMAEAVWASAAGWWGDVGGVMEMPGDDG
jgi:hypothetical protein